jgi:hypothetical protein
MQLTEVSCNGQAEAAVLSDRKPLPLSPEEEEVPEA